LPTPYDSDSICRSKHVPGPDSFDATFAKSTFCNGNVWRPKIQDFGANRSKHNLDAALFTGGFSILAASSAAHILFIDDAIQAFYHQKLLAENASFLS
jgi:hypothetical protein